MLSAGAAHKLDVWGVFVLFSALVTLYGTGSGVHQAHLGESLQTMPRLKVCVGPQGQGPAVIMGVL